MTVRWDKVDPGLERIAQRNALDSASENPPRGRSEMKRKTPAALYVLMLTVAGSAVFVLASSRSVNPAIFFGLLVLGWWAIREWLGPVENRNQWAVGLVIVCLFVVAIIANFLAPSPQGLGAAGWSSLPAEAATRLQRGSF
jgi:hypothetical protein